MYPVQSYIGTINLDPAYTPRKLIHKQISEAIILSLDPEFVLSIDNDHINSNHIELLQNYGKEDPVIFQIGQALKKEIESRSSFQVYVDSLTVCLSAHLLRYYSTTKYNFKEYKGGLSKNQLDTVIEYINSYLSEDISLKTLANITGLSQFYFSRQFKKSMGISPYQYIIKKTN
ncbi:helix-turn-helix transcriptional regulator (plasmid) [Acaryochloris sp. 'Moss Beach']|uniref:helix-turn-helix transcriptional regulator n=1 Tax=Acaryochloris sp. 'Moss Beach' TaxID=2740837 RepID=UPI001F193A4C|nr:AraC family transcriptional regulator [Acaryochloris sp. 'Moss Beach']UJB73324.1 helix-turn-helix transcriptional regulator [Acaryochloris sp. 'Moss Beach']